MKKKRSLATLSCICSVLLLAALPALAANGPEITTQGYSIFHETMVDLSWPEIEKAAKDGAIILFPVTVIEEHGPHQSIGVDTYMSYLRCKLARRELESRGIKTLIAPPFYWGINSATGAWPGSFYSRPSTLKAILWDVLFSLKRWGFEYVFVQPGHGDPDHNFVVLDAIKEARKDFGIMAYAIYSNFNAKRWDLLGKEYVLIDKSPDPPATPMTGYIDRHAAGGETSYMAYYFPDQVNMELAKTLPPTEVTWDAFQTWLQGWSIARKMTPLGYVGFPAKFNPEAGKKSVEEGVKYMADTIESFMKGAYKPREIK